MRTLLPSALIVTAACTPPQPAQGTPSRVPTVETTPGKGDSLPMGGEKLIRGVVTENRLGCLADASCSLFLRVDDEEFKVVYDYGGEIPPCTNQASVQGRQIKVGDLVEVFGEYREPGGEKAIVTCGSPDYYIRILE